MKRRGHTRAFVKADYYELDWYYEECTDGKTRICWRFVQWHLVVEVMTQTTNGTDITGQVEMCKRDIIYIYNIVVSNGYYGDTELWETEILTAGMTLV